MGGLPQSTKESPDEPTSLYFREITKTSIRIKPSSDDVIYACMLLKFKNDSTSVRNRKAIHFWLGSITLHMVCREKNIYNHVN